MIQMNIRNELNYWIKRKNLQYEIHNKKMMKLLIELEMLEKMFESDWKNEEDREVMIETLKEIDFE
jgi:hypothetical protein